MNDTSLEIQRMQVAIVKRLTPNQRIALACEMYMSARELILRSLPESLSQSERLAELYRRFYGQEPPSGFVEKCSSVADGT